MTHDILVVGGGPAGLAAALYAARAGKTVAVLERAVPGGQIVYSPLVENYPALPGVSGADFAAALAGQTEALGVEIITAEAVSAVRTEGGFRLETDEGAMDCRTLILATGVQHRALGLPGEAELVGTGISYCAVCDGAFYAGRDVAVVGGGDTAVQDALFLANLCRRVTLLVRRDRLRASDAAKAETLRQRDNVELRFSTTVEALCSADGALTGVTVRERGETAALAIDGLFLAVGQEPSGSAFAALAPVDAQGYFAAGENCIAAPGVFVAGDCRAKTVRQLATAVGDGACAALSACACLERNG